MRTSCGFLIQCEDKFLLCHATKPSGSISLSDGQWGIPKGGCEEGESQLEAALRETVEETGLVLANLNFPTEPIKEYATKTKRYVVFYCKYPDVSILNSKLVCKSLIVNSDKPENDDFVWVDWKTASEIAIKNQKFNLFTDEVKELLQIGD